MYEQEEGQARKREGKGQKSTDSLARGSKKNAERHTSWAKPRIKRVPEGTQNKRSANASRTQQTACAHGHQSTLNREQKHTRRRTEKTRDRTSKGRGGVQTCQTQAKTVGVPPSS